MNPWKKVAAPDYGIGHRRPTGTVARRSGSQTEAVRHAGQAARSIGTHASQNHPDARGRAGRGFLLPVADLTASDRHNPWASGSPEVQRSAPECPRGRFPDRDYDPSRLAESRGRNAPGLPPHAPEYRGYGPQGPCGVSGAPSFHAPGGMPGGHPYGYSGSPGYPGMGGPAPVFPGGMGDFPFP